MSQIAYRYAVIRAVPRADRDEQLNIGIVLYCQAKSFLACRFSDDLDPLKAFGLDSDGLAGVRSSIDSIAALCDGDPRGRAAAARTAAFRFGHVTAPRSTVVRAGPTHGGVGTDPNSALDDLYTRLVAR